MTTELQGICNFENGEKIEVFFDLGSGNFVFKLSSGQQLHLDISEVRKLKKTVAVSEQAYASWASTKAKSGNMSLF